METKKISTKFQIKIFSQTMGFKVIKSVVVCKPGPFLMGLWQQNNNQKRSIQIGDWKDWFKLDALELNPCDPQSGLIPP